MAYDGPGGPKRSETFATGSARTARNFASFAPPDGTASSGLHAHFSARKWAFWPPGDQQATGAPGSPKSDFSARPYLQNQGATGRTNVLYPHLNHGFGGECGMYGPVTFKMDGEMKFYRSARKPPSAWPTPRRATHDSAKCRVRKNPDQKHQKKS